MSQDVGEAKNQQAANPAEVQQLTKLMEKYIADGRSTPGKPQKNDVEVKLWKRKATPPGRNKDSAEDGPEDGGK